MEVLDPVPEVFLATYYQVLEESSAILDQGLEAILDQDAAVELAQSDESPLAAESKSGAKSRAEAELEARSHQNREVVGARDALEDVANLDQDGLGLEANLDQDGRDLAAEDEQDDRVQVDRNRDLPDETDDFRANCYQDAHQDRRCSTKHLRGLMPLSYLISGVLG